MIADELEALAATLVAEADYSDERFGGRKITAGMVTGEARRQGRVKAKRDAADRIRKILAAHKGEDHDRVDV